MRVTDQRQQTPAERLTAAGQSGYDLYPRDCSHSVWHMMKQLGLNEPYRVANAMMAHFAARGSGWRQVTLAEAGTLADEGKIVIGGLANASGNGHVQMVMPGSQPSGGYRMPNGKMAGSSGMYPRSAGGALGSWPGARSRGERTVRDAWSRTDWPSVTFWTHD